MNDFTEWKFQRHIYLNINSWIKLICLLNMVNMSLGWHNVARASLPLSAKQKRKQANILTVRSQPYNYHSDIHWFASWPIMILHFLIPLLRRTRSSFPPCADPFLSGLDSRNNIPTKCVLLSTSSPCWLSPALHFLKLPSHALPNEVLHLHRQHSFPKMTKYGYNPVVISHGTTITCGRPLPPFRTFLNLNLNISQWSGGLQPMTRISRSSTMLPIWSKEEGTSPIFWGSTNQMGHGRRMEVTWVSAPQCTLGRDKSSHYMPWELNLEPPSPWRRDRAG